jgi:hypothetical protein
LSLFVLGAKSIILSSTMIATFFANLHYPETSSIRSGGFAGNGGVYTGLNPEGLIMEILAREYKRG